MVGQKFTKTRDKDGTRTKYLPSRKVCAFCANKAEVIDYKDAVKLRQYLSNRGRIEPRRRTGLCAKHQHGIALAIKKARHLAFLPFAPVHIFKTGGVGITS